MRFVDCSASRVRLAASSVRPKVRTQQILHAIARLASNDRRIAKAARVQFVQPARRRRRRHAPRRAPRMRQFEVEQRLRGQATAHASEADARRRPAPSCGPHGSRLFQLSHSLAPGNSFFSAPAPSRWPRSSAMPIRSSHASNSGARRRPSTLRDIQRIVERGALVVEHHVVRAGHAHHEVHAGHGQQRQQRIHVVLIGLGVIGVANVAAHGQAEQLAAEMIFEAGANDLLAVEEILRADETDDCSSPAAVENAAPPHRRALRRFADPRRDAHRRRARFPAPSRNTSRCRRPCRVSVRVPLRALRRAAPAKRRSSRFVFSVPPMD